MGDKKGIVDLFFLAGAQMGDRKDITVSALFIDHKPGIFGAFKDTVSSFTLIRRDQYYESVRFSQRTGKYHYSFSNLLNNPPRGQNKDVEFVTRDPGLIARRLTQYKVA